MASAIATVPASCAAQTLPGECMFLFAIARILTGQVAGDHHALDLARALVDLRDARIAVVALDRVVVKVSVAAVDLDRLGADPFRELRSIELRLRGFGKAGLAFAAHARRVQDEQPRGVDARVHVREVVADGRVLDQLLAELRTLASVSERRFEGRACDAEGLRGDADAPTLEVRQRDGESLAAWPEKVFFGDLAVLEHDGARVRCLDAELRLELLRHEALRRGGAAEHPAAFSSLAGGGAPPDAGPT